MSKYRLPGIDVGGIVAEIGSDLALALIAEGYELVGGMLEADVEKPVIKPRTRSRK